MKKRIIILFVIALIVTAGAIWYLIPSHFLSNVSTDEIAYINIFNGNNGRDYKITDKNAIEHILDNIQAVSFQKDGVSLAHKGYSYRITFYNDKDDVIEHFIINSADTIRKDPFFYHDNTSSLDIDYIKNLLSDGTKTITIYDKAYNPDTEQSFVGTVLEETTTYMVVEPAEDEYERTVAENIKIEYGTDHVDYLYGTGRKVVIYYKGGINTNDGKMSSIKSDDISVEGFREWKLKVVPTKLESFKMLAVAKAAPHDSDSSSYWYRQYNLYYYDLDEVMVSVDGQEYPLAHALKLGKITMSAIIAKANQDVSDGIIDELVYKDGGSQVYKYPDYTIVKYHTLDGNDDMYIGTPDIGIDVKDK